MTKLLLDYPWRLEAAIDNPDVGIALEGFLNLLARTELEPVAFIDDVDQAEFFQNHNSRLTRNHLPLIRLLKRCRRAATTNCESAINPPPNNLTVAWKRGLRDELNRTDEWRTPQIVVTPMRIPDWPYGATTVVAHSPQCQQLPTPAARVLVLVPLDTYKDHPHALADLDPWDVRCTAPIQQEKPCYLPNPLVLDHDPCKEHLARTPIGELDAAIFRARQKGCTFRQEYFYYIPPQDWRADAVDIGRWRAGHAFPREKATDRTQVGPIDYQSHVWTWDEAERHWDIQYGGNQYVSVSHLGKILKSKL